MKTILLIEDSLGDQFLGEHAIETAIPGVEIIIASDGQEAIEILENMATEPDLILLDINMPRMNGHAFLAAFTNGNTRDIPVVVMLTSSDQGTDKEQALSYKCVKDYLLKPITPEAILQLQKLVDSIADGES